MTDRWSLESRLTTWYSAVLFAGILVVSVALWLVFERAALSTADARLAERVARMVEFLDLESDSPATEDVAEEAVEYLLGVAEGQLTQLRDAADRQIFPPHDLADPPVPWQDVATGPVVRTLDVSGVPHRVLSRRVAVLDADYAVLVATSLESLDRARAQVVASLLVVIPVALLISLGTGVQIASRAIAPVEEVTRAADEIRLGSLDRRIPVPETGDAIERLARTFNAMLERLEESVTRLEQFSVDASHELRTPVSIVRSTAELALRHGRSVEEYRSDLEAIQDEAERLGELIDVLLTLARTGSHEIPMSEVDLGDVVRSVGQGFRGQVETKGLSLRLLLPDARLVVRGNLASLRRLLGSLLENALEHTREGGITVALERTGASVVLRVQDTGEGIPQEALSRIFERHFGVDSGRRGTRLGVGLSIARRIARLHGTELRVDSQAGRGTEFTAHFASG